MTMIDKVESSKHLAMMIKLSGKSRRRIAEECHFDAETLDSYGSGKRFPSLDNIYMLSRCLGCSIEDLIITKEVG